MNALTDIRRALVIAVFTSIALILSVVGSAVASVPAQETAPHLSMIAQSFFVNDTSGLRIQLRLTGATIDLAPETPPVDPPNPVVPNLVPLLVIDAFAPISDPASVAGAPTGGPIGSLSVPLSDIATSTENGLEIDLTLPSAAGAGADRFIDALNIAASGVYPLEIRIVDVGTVARTSTFVNRTPTQVQPADQLAAGIIVAIREIGPSPTDADRSAARDELNRLIELTEATDLPLTVMLPPSVIDHVLVGEPDLQRKVTDALAGQTVLAAPSFALEPDAAIGAGITDDLRAAWTAGTSKLRTNLPLTNVDTSTMLVDAPISDAGIDLLHEIGMRLAIVPNSVYRFANGEIGDFTDPGLLVQLRTSDATAVPAAVGSPALGLLDRPDPNTTDPSQNEPTPTERAIRLLAHLTAQQSSPSTSSRSVFLMTPEIGVPDPEVIAAVAAITGTPQDAEPTSLAPITFAPVAELADRTESHVVAGKPVTISWSVKPVDIIGNRLIHVAAAERVVRESVSMLPAEDPRRESWVVRVRSAESTSLTDQQAGVLIADSLAQAEQLRQAVPSPEPFEFTLTGEDTTLRFQLTNNAATPLDVLFLLKSDRLIAPEQTKIRLTPNSVTDVPIQVSARSNGSASVRVQIVTPDGLALFAPVEMNGRVTTFGGTGKLVTVGALLVLATWWLSFLNRRRRSSAVPNDGQPSTEVDPATAPRGPDDTSGAATNGADTNGDDTTGGAAASAPSHELGAG